MATSIEFNASARSEHGKVAVRRLRREQGLVPAVVFGAGKAAQSIQLSHRDLEHALEDEATYTQVLTLTIDGKSEPVVLKDVQRHPSRPRLLHADFQRIKAKEKLTMIVPLHFEGEESAPGIKSGGIASHMVTEIEITCLPANLPQHLSLNVAGVELGQTLHLSDIPLPKGVSLVGQVDAEHDSAVYSIHAPRAAEEPAAAAGAAADDAPEAESSDNDAPSTEQQAD